MDEVEAALDDANIDRFINCLRKLSGIQFALVTHQKATMEHADVIYGVTMPEKGVSRYCPWIWTAILHYNSRKRREKELLDYDIQRRKKKSFFGKMSQRISDALAGKTTIDDDFMDELEEILITSDIGMETTMKIVDMLRTEVKTNNLTKPSVIKIRLAKIIASVINKKDAQQLCQDTPLVILMIGINGGGKTTSIGKLAHKLRQEGKTVMLAAADTFRAAAAEQLCIWGDRVGVNVVKHQEGADPSAVIYDAIQSAKAKNIDVLICDTAGRLQNKKNLMDELNKMNKIIGREYPEAARENLLVLDATTGKTPFLR